MTVYRKTDGTNLCFEHLFTTKQWQVKSIVNKGKDRCWAHCDSPTKTLPEECLDQWKVWEDSKVVPVHSFVFVSLCKIGGKWETQPAITVTTINNEEGEAACVVKGTEESAAESSEK